jgi:hypothetical protein
MLKPRNGATHGKAAIAAAPPPRQLPGKRVKLLAEARDLSRWQRDLRASSAVLS